MRSGIGVAAAVTTLAWVGACFAETLVVPIQGIRAIEDGAGATRVLVKFGPIEGLEDMAISRAYLAVNSERRGELTRPIAI